MENNSLDIFGWGLFLPPTKPIREMVLEVGGNPTNFLKTGWQNVSIAGKDSSPNSMALAALKTALTNTGVNPKDLKLVISTSEAHDYLEMSTAMEMIRELELPGTCLGFDLYQDCMATAIAFKVAGQWLSSLGGGFAAIVSAEYFSRFIDRTSKDTETFWGHGDGASAIIVGKNVDRPGKLKCKNSSFYTKGTNNGYMHPIYGGTQKPSVEQGQNQAKRRVAHITNEQMFLNYIEGFSAVMENLKSQCDFTPNWLVCSQTNPGIMKLVTNLIEVPDPLVAVTGDKVGHIGCSDIALGLNLLSESGRLKGQGLIATYSSSTWSATLCEA